MTPRVTPLSNLPAVGAAQAPELQVAPQPAPPAPIEPPAVEAQPIAPSAAKRAPRRARYVLAAVAVTALIAYGSRTRHTPPIPPPVTLMISPAWTDVDLSPFRSVPLVGLRSRTALRFRTNDERIQLVQPGTEVAIRTVGVRKLEVRTVGGRAEVTLTPQAQ